MFVPYLAREDAETYDLLFSGDLAEYERTYNTSTFHRDN